MTDKETKINELTSAQLKAVMPLLPAAKRELFLPYLNAAMAEFNINTEKRIAMFLAQVAQESLQLSKWIENLNYSARRLTEVWDKRFPNLQAALPYAHNPCALANKVYNGRMGNRVGTEDGFVFRGRCPIQATGREMYAEATAGVGARYGVDFVKNPDLLLQPKYGFLVAAWIFAVEKDCLALADRGDVRTCTLRINGGLHGLAERTDYYQHALRVLPDDFKLNISTSENLTRIETLADIEPNEPNDDLTISTLEQPKEQTAPVAQTTETTELTVQSAQEAVVPAIAGGGAGETGTIIKKERVSIFVKIWAAVTAGVGAAAGLGINLQGFIDRAADGLTPKRLLITAFCLSLVAFAFWLYDRAAERAQARTQKKADIAANGGLINVEMQ